MAPTLHQLPLTAPPLPAVARWLLDHRPGNAPEDLASTLVILPSTRACGQLGHALLEVSGKPALLLPRIVTPNRLADDLADLLGLGDGSACDPSLRAAVLTPRLEQLAWLEHMPESALGLAGEFVALFDEVRLAGCEPEIFDGTDDPGLMARAESGSEEVVRTDLDRIREVWHLYREVLPRDHIDGRIDALASAGQHWPGQAPTLIAAAHLGRLDGVFQRYLENVSAIGVPLYWLMPRADDPRSRSLLATYRDEEAWSNPLAGMRRLAERVCGEAPPVEQFEHTDLPSRITAMEPGPAKTPRRLACRDPEHESRVVAAEVCRGLAAGNPTPRIIVATADLGLAARIAAHLRDAGVDVDDTRGRSLSGLPAGRLLRDLLRTVAGRWPFESLFELLTHPYVRLTDPADRPGHAARVQVLEAAVRRTGSARAGLEVLRSVAERDDQGRKGWSLAEFVDRLGASAAPLSDLAAATVPWSTLLQGLRDTWTRLAPDRGLTQPPDPRQEFDDLGALDSLLASLEHAAPHLGETTLAGAAATLTRLLSDPAWEVRPHRQRNLPVRLMGLVEARLEDADLLFLAGLDQDVFPGRLPRPLLLPERMRRSLGLSHWRETGGLAAELFLRLLHTAPNIVMSWPTERGGDRCLPSPLVQRLELVASAPCDAAPEPPLFRRTAPDVTRFATAEQAFHAEPVPVLAPKLTPPQRLSHTALQTHRDCPYRYLLAHAMRLRRPDPLSAEFTPRDLGTAAHATMERWLAPDGDGAKHLAAGDRALALAALTKAAEATFKAPGEVLPGRDVALRAFLGLASNLVDVEIERQKTWRSAALESDFSVPLDRVVAWLRGEGTDAPNLPADQGSLQLVGVIDRIDVRRDNPSVAAVIDYKTGALPQRGRVTDGRELQLALYALAVEVGTVAGLDPAPPSGRTVDHGGFYPLSGKTPGQMAIFGDRDEFIAGVQSIVTQAMAILDPDTPFGLVPDWQGEDPTGNLPCVFCDFRGVCRLEERETSVELAARMTAMLTANRGGRI